MIKIRTATKADKEEILSFCSNTFSWGDYIDQVWDFWYRDRNGRLLVAEESGSKKKIAMSHAAVCPDEKSVWLEGIRVHPDYRRSQIASKLIEKMLHYGRQKGARQASAIVAADNAASQRMMEKNSFEIISRWVFYSTADRLRPRKSEARLATARDLDAIWQYLNASEVYRLSAKMYVRSWHWYQLDRRALQNLVGGQRVVVIGQRPVDGVAVINRTSYWTRKNILQVVYLDSTSLRPLRHLMSFVTNMYIADKFQHLQVVCHRSKSMTSVLEKFMTEEEEQFLLYNKVLVA